MPHKPPHHCNYPGCPHLTTKRYCPQHQKKADQDYEQGRGTAIERGYDYNWHKIRTLKLNYNPLCERCLLIGRAVIARLVHHKDSNPYNNDDNNLESLCEPCHDAEHKKERWEGRLKS
jgi:5-methylcytosine-specific restriction protein A